MSYSGAYGPGLIIKHTGQFFPLTQEPVEIGRATGNTLVLADPEVSGRHATIYWQPDINLYVIQDEGSTNGTYVNDRRISGPEPLRDGDVIRTGNTLMDLRLEAAADATQPLAAGAYPLPPDQESDDRTGNLVLPGVIIVLLAGITVACLLLAAILLLGGRKGVPTITIQSPADGATVLTGNEIILQATASGANDITLIELSVDGGLVASTTSPDPAGTSMLTISKPWTFETPGQHAVSAVAYTAGGETSRTESVEVTVVSAVAAGTSTPTPTGEPGEPTNTPPAEATETPTPTPEPGAPQIEYFRANPQSITAGECTTLEWGNVTDARRASIEPDVGGVASPGSTTVCPLQTTTYVLTAEGPGGATTASTTASVGGALADLTVDAISFDPNPPVVDQETEVSITVRNAGPGAAGGFNWDWTAGGEGYFNGRLGGLNAGEATVVTVRWTPANAHDRLTTTARVDTDNEVAETDERNNELVAVVQVVEGAPGPGTTTIQSSGELDGYRANNGGGSTREAILVGNGNIVDTGEAIWRGFISFELASIPNEAVIQGIELRFYQGRVVGDPYGKLGNVILDHVDYGSRLSGAAYDLPAMDSAVLPQQTAPGVWYILSDPTIANWIEDDLAAGRPRFQLRLRFSQESDGDGVKDYVSFESGNNYLGTGNLPQLTVAYGQ